jgi:hypothetical protein
VLSTGTRFLTEPPLSRIDRFLASLEMTGEGLEMTLRVYESNVSMQELVTILPEPAPSEAEGVKGGEEGFSDYHVHTIDQKKFRPPSAVRKNGRG